MTTGRLYLLISGLTGALAGVAARMLGAGWLAAGGVALVGAVCALVALCCCRMGAS